MNKEEEQQDDEEEEEDDNKKKRKEQAHMSPVQRWQESKSVINKAEEKMDVLAEKAKRRYTV